MTLFDCLTIAVKYGDDASADHDIVYFNGPPSPEEGLRHESQVWNEETKNDAESLEKLGARYNSQFRCWSLFV